MPEERFRFEVPGRGEVSAAADVPSGADAMLVMAHGAGAGMDHPFMAGFTRACNELGIATMRFNFPYMEAGKRSTDQPGVAIAAWLAAHESAVARSAGAPVWAGGKSFGGRMASMAVAEGMPAAGLVFLGYPLHPPGNPDKIRSEHLTRIDAPMLFLQGTRDAFASWDRLESIVRDLGPRSRLIPIEGGGHSFNLSRRDDPGEVAASLAPLAAGFIRERG